MRAGRRSTIWCSARCSSRPARLDRGGRAGLRPRGGRILEVGVGTGISLPDYARVNRLVGIDLSEPMLRKAQARVAEQKLEQCRGAGGDGRRARWRCRTRAFDVVVAQYVITAVPDPEATLDEFARVLRPGGEIVLVNHIGAEGGPRRRVRAMLRADRAPARLAAGVPLPAAGRLGRPPRRRAHDRAPPMPPLGHFSLIRFERARASSRRRSRGRPEIRPKRRFGAYCRLLDSVCRGSLYRPHSGCGRRWRGSSVG